MESRTRLGLLIKTLRQQSGKTLEQVGSTMGVHRGYMHSMESGKMTIPIKALHSFTKLYPKHRDELIQAWLDADAHKSIILQKTGTPLDLKIINDYLEWLD